MTAEASDAMTSHQAVPALQQPQAPAPEPVSRWLLVLGYIAALLFPVVGIVIGCLALMRRAVGHGLTLILISAAVASLSILVSTHADHRSAMQQWRDYNACARAQGYELKKVTAGCDVPDASPPEARRK
jgi:hypothetical protein